MKRLRCISLFLLLLGASCLIAQDGARMVYPTAKRVDQVDDYHGVKVADPYRWLEDTNSAETKDWVEAENKLTFRYLEGIPSREAIRDRMTKLWNYERFTVPELEGGRYFFQHNDGLQNQNVLLVADSLTVAPRMLLDPNTLSAHGTVALSGTAITDDGRVGQVLDGIKEGGVEDNTIVVLSSDNGITTGAASAAGGSSGPWRGNFYQPPSIVNLAVTDAHSDGRTCFAHADANRHYIAVMHAVLSRVA